MSTPVILPALGEAVDSATISAWLKSVGDDVAVGEPLVEVSTDKVDTEIESTVAGTVTEIRVVEDEVAHVGDVIAVIGDAAGSTDETPVPVPEPVAAAPELSSEVSRAPASAPAGDAPSTVGPASESATGIEVDGELRGTTQKLTRLRRTIAARMVESLQTSAQLTTIVEVDVTSVGQLRRRLNAQVTPDHGVKLTFLPFVAVAATRALQRYPQVNSVVDVEAGTVTYPKGEHLGIAVDTEKGLFVPVIRDAGSLTVTELAVRIAEVAEKTRASRIKPDELQGGTFTITNTGSRGALMDTPIINQPQVAILGAGVVTRRPVAVGREGEDESIALRSMLYLSLTYDHRIVDGADASRYLSDVKGRLEEFPDQWVGTAMLST